MIPVIGANVKKSFGMVNYLEKGIRFYPIEHCEYIQVLEDNINPIYFVKVLEVEETKQRFSRSNRASINRISSLFVKVPDIKIQNQIAEIILNLE